MFRQSPSRNQRSKGIKGKSFLQICLLLAVCFWLIYQVKHSHDKKKQFDENNANSSLEKQSDDVILKFGRKDIRPKVEETSTEIENHEEEALEEEETGGEEDNNKHEEENVEEEENNRHEEEDNGGEEENKQEEEDIGGEEENKHEEQELEEDGKTEEKEDEGRGDGDGEIDDHDQEKSDIDVDRAEAFIDEEEREESNEKESEKDEEEKGQTEDESSSEDHNRDGGERNTHEAREEHYKADDASSAVTHDGQSISSETQKGNLENPNENNGTGIIEHDNEVDNTEETVLGQNATYLTVRDGQMAENGTSFNATTNEEKVYEIISSKSESASVLNSTIETVSKDQVEVSNNSTEASTDTHDSSPQKGTESVSASTQVQFNSNSTISVGKPSNSSIISEPVILEQGSRSNASAETESSSGREENLDMPENEKSDNSNEIDGMNGGSDSLKTENADEVQQDDIDSSDHVEEKDVRTDLDTLPEIQTEGSNTEDTATE